MPLVADKWGCLLINVGTPKSAGPDDVGKYLSEFLLDPEVIDKPWWLRQLLVRLVIVPRRRHASAKLYEKIWTEQGSPLHVFTQELSRRLHQQLDKEIEVAYGFRYGEPSLEDAVNSLEDRGVKNLFVLPLYPQYATSSVRTSLKALAKLDLEQRFAKVVSVTSFHNEDFYIESLTAAIRPKVRPSSHILFSFHSLPVRHIAQNHAGCGDCVSLEKCTKLGESNCYRRQCVETCELVAQKLGLPPQRWSISYQSKLGREPWLTPSTPQQIEALTRQGKTDLIVVNPGFIVDCLETLEEVDMQAREQFKGLGGVSWDRIPCLNAGSFWVEQLGGWIGRRISREAYGKTTP